MNCKPGDLAVIVVGENAGAFVEVLRRAPTHNFFLPNMQYCTGIENGWIVQAMGPPLLANFEGGQIRPVHIGPCADYKLRPIRPPREPVATVRELEATV